MPEIRATAGGDWVVGVGASYVPCPKHCGRMVADRVNDRPVRVAPCTRCVRLDVLESFRSTSDRALRARMDAESS